MSEAHRAKLILDAKDYWLRRAVKAEAAADALAEALAAMTGHPGAGHVETCASCSGPVACDCGFSDALKALVTYHTSTPDRKACRGAA